jgi:hypothetical protein
MMILMGDWRDQEVTNETIFREMNEWTAEANGVGPGSMLITRTYHCECSDHRCTDRISLTHSEYEAVRAVAVRFAIALDHENPEVDRVVFENERFATVEKCYGAGAKIARATDPRRT